MQNGKGDKHHFKIILKRNQTETNVLDCVIFVWSYTYLFGHFSGMTDGSTGPEQRSRSLGVPVHLARLLIPAFYCLLSIRHLFIYREYGLSKVTPNSCNFVNCSVQRHFTMRSRIYVTFSYKLNCQSSVLTYAHSCNKK